MRRKNTKNTLLGIVAILALCFAAVNYIIPALTSTQAFEDGMSVAAGTLISMVSEKESEEVLAAESSSQESAVFDNSDHDDVYIEYIDVGQGDCTFIYNKSSDYSALIDTGLYEAYDNVQATLKDYGIKNLDILILTHPDTDHIQSAVDVIEDYNVKTIYMSRAVNEDAKAYNYLMEYLSEYQGEVLYPSLLDEARFGSDNASLFFLGPAAYEDLEDTNGNSLIVKLVNGADSFLFVGDATGKEMAPLMQMGIKLDSEVLKASHHGSANDGCNSEEFVKYVDPEAMIISCGYGNEHGHPHIETMDLVQKYNISLYRTDLQGSIALHSTGNGIVFAQDPSTNYLNGNSLR